MSDIRCYMPLSAWLPYWPTGLFNEPNLDGIAIVQYSGSCTGGIPSYQVTLAYTQEISIGLPGVEGLSLILMGSGGWTELKAEVDLTSIVEIRLLDLSVVLRCDSALLQPVTGSAEQGWVPVTNTSGQPAPLDLTVMVSTLSVDLDGQMDLEGIPALTLPPVMIGSTGLVVEAAAVDLHLSGTDIPPAGQNAGFRGISLDSVTIYLPPQLQIPGLTGSSILAENVRVGSCGLSGTFTGAWLPSWSGTNVSGDGAGSLIGIPFGMESLSITILQNTLTEGSIKGSVLIPYFNERVQVSLSLGQDGSFSISLDQADDSGLVELTIPGVAAMKVSSLGLDAGDSALSILLSGSIQLLVGSPELDWPEIEIQNLSISPDGQIRLPGGWLDLQQPLALNLFGFAMEISRIGFGSLEDQRRWVSFSGGLHLIDLLPTGVSVEGLKVTWDPSGVISPQLSLAGVGLEMTIPGVLSLAGEVALAQDDGENVFQGVASLELVPLGISLDASVKIGHNSNPQFTYFYTFLDLELPIGIPLWTRGAAIYGISGLYGANVLPNAADHDWYAWYRSDPAFDIQDSRKWTGAADGQAFGAGMTLGTLFDAGHVLSTKSLFALVLPGPTILFDGKANLLMLPPDLNNANSEGIFDLLAVLDAQSGFLQVDIDAGWQQAQVLDINASAEAYFNFSNPRLWHLYLGQDTPEDKRIRASALELFNADAYLMIDSQGIASGFGVSWGEDWKFGPVKVVLKSWVEAAAAITYQPPQLEGSLSMGGDYEVSIAGFGAGIAMEATLSAKAPTLYWIKGQLDLDIKLPVPLKDLHEQILLEWKEDQVPAILPPGINFGVEHLKVDETWKPSRPDSPLFPGDAGFDPGPIVPLDARPSIAFDRSVKDETTGIDLTSVSVYAGPVRIGDYDFDYKVTSLKFEKWPKAGGTTWDAVPDLYGSWQAVEDGSGEPAASKLLLWALSPFAFTRQTSRLYQDTFLTAHLDWPCADAPQPDLQCVNWEDVGLDVSFGPVFSRAGLTFTLTNNAQTRAMPSEGCKTRQALALVNGDTLWVVFPEPVRNIAVCLAKGAFLSAQAYAAGVQVDQNLIVSGTVLFHGQGIDTLRLNAAANVFLAGICYETEALAGQIDSVQEHTDRLFAGLSHWSSAEAILEPETWYRLTLGVETVRAHNGEESSSSFTYYAGFQTAGAPGLVPSTAAADAPLEVAAGTELAQPPYPLGGQLVSAAPYVEWQIPVVGALAVYRAYDLGVDFNETYVEQMYGADMQIRLLDRNGKPVLDENGDEASFANQWGQAPTAELSETELPYYVRVTDCLGQAPVSLPPNQKIVFTNGLLFEDDFSSGLDNWSDPNAPGGDPTRNWTVSESALQWVGTSFPSLGALLVAGDPAWQDYAVEVELSSAGDQVGLVFRYQPDGGSYYRLVLDSRGRRLERVARSTVTSLWQDTLAYVPGKVQVLGVQCQGERLRGQADGELLFDLRDAGGFSAGQVGIFANSAAAFERFLVREWPGGVLEAQAQYSAELMASFVLFQGGLLDGWTDPHFAWQEWTRSKAHIAALGRPDWEDYRLEVNISDITQQAGMIVRFQQQASGDFSCYRLLLNPEDQVLKLARLEGTLSGSNFSLSSQGRSEIWSCKGDTCGIDFSLNEHTLALTCSGPSLLVEVDGLQLVEILPDVALETGQMGLYYESDAAPAFSDMVVRSAPRQPVLQWSFITSRYPGLVEHLDTFTGAVYPEAVNSINLADYKAIVTAASASLDSAVSALTGVRQALTAAGVEDLSALRAQAQVAVAALNGVSSAQFDVLYALFFPSGFRPFPPVVELSEIVQNKSRLALLLESPEPLDWTRLTTHLSVLDPASNTYQVQARTRILWNLDGARALLVFAAGAPIPAGSYRLSFTSSLDQGVEAPLLRRSGSSLSETAALQFSLA